MLARRRLGTNLVCAVTVFAMWGTHHPGGASPSVMRLAVSFEVGNVNGSRLPCSTDGTTYTIAGEIVGPSDAADLPSLAGTLYLHEFSFGKFFWSFGDVEGYDYAAALAERGHVSIIVDRLGYDDSGHPPGTHTCLGAHADIAAQIVGHLRAGTYSAGSHSPLAFDRIVLAGHSVGGGVAELAAHSFGDLDLSGLMLFAWADQGYSVRSIQQSLRQGQDCSGGGEPAEPGTAGGYAFFGRTPEDFRGNVFNDTDPAVIDAATSRRNRDPCGDNATLARLAAINAAGVGEIDVPVLLVFGERDAIFEAFAADLQAQLFMGSPDVSLVRVAGAGHALLLERSAPTVYDVAADWLEGRGV